MVQRGTGAERVNDIFFHAVLGCNEVAPEDVVNTQDRLAHQPSGSEQTD